MTVQQPEFLVRHRGDRLAPEIQSGDALSVREADTAELGGLVVVTGADGEASVQRYDGTSRVAGVVMGVYRRLL